jgi:serine/threonine-protein kinase
VQGDEDIGNLPTVGEDDDATYVEPGSARRASKIMPAAKGDISEGTVDETRDIDSRSPSRPGSSELAGSHTSSTHWTVAPTSPLEALRVEEIDRTRLFCYIVYALAILVPTTFVFVGGSTEMKYLVDGCIFVTVLATVRLHYLLNLADRDYTNEIVIVAMIAAITAFSGVVTWGVFSVAPAIIVLGLYFFSRSESNFAATLLYLTCAGLQLCFAVLMLTDVIEDPGIFQRTGSIKDQYVAQGLVQCIYLATFFIARGTRASSLRTISQLQKAMHQLSNREVLLQEVKEELERALRVDGAGRYTDQPLGSWNLKQVLGRGAMGEVYEATHNETEALAAVKVLHTNIMQSTDHVIRFFREAKAASTLKSKHVVKVLEVSGMSEVVPYIAMERLVGSDLAFHLRKKRKFAVAEVHKLLREVGTVLDLAREKGIVHRDIKPQNLLLSQEQDGHAIWKVLDFGVSKLGESTGTLTQGHVIGTPAYMAPEQAQGQVVDAQADLYALGAVAYRCLTGRPPFSGKEIAVIIFNVVCEMPPRPSLLANLHEDMDYVLGIALAKDPTDRFKSATEFSAALKLAAKGELDAETRERAQEILKEMPWSEQH